MESGCWTQGDEKRLLLGNAFQRSVALSFVIPSN